MTPPVTSDQPQPDRQRIIDELDVLAQVAQAQCDAIPQRRFRFLFSPKAHARAIMLRHVIELLAVLASAFAAPAEAAAPVIPTDAAVPDQAVALATVDAPSQPVAPVATAKPATAKPATAKSAAIAEPPCHHPIVPPAQLIRATGTTSRPARRPPQRAGAAPNPNSTARARHDAPHRPHTPGATRQRPPQRLREAALTH